MELLKVNLLISITELILLAAAISLFVRLFLSLFRAIEQKGEGHGPHLLRNLIHAFSGIGAVDPYSNDYWQTYILGIIELCCLPVLIAGGKPEYVAGWFILKTLPQWPAWQKSRWVYNRFLIGNALVLSSCYFISRTFFVLSK